MSGDQKNTPVPVRKTQNFGVPTITVPAVLFASRREFARYIWSHALEYEDRPRHRFFPMLVTDVAIYLLIAGVEPAADTSTGRTVPEEAPNPNAGAMSLADMEALYDAAEHIGLTKKHAIEAVYWLRERKMNLATLREMLRAAHWAWQAEIELCAGEVA